MAETMTLTDFLLARIAEDEELVDRHELENGRKWMAFEDADNLETKVLTYPPDPDTWVIAITDNLSTAEHLAAYHPARVLAECEAKRRIVEEGSYQLAPVRPAFGDWLLRVLALPYADHPDYREEWRP